VKLVLFAMLLELDLVLVYLLRGRSTILIAEQTKQRARKALRKLDRGGRLLRRQFLLAHHHTAAAEVDGGIYALAMTSKQEGVPTTRAGAQYADFSIEIGLSAQPCHRAGGVADDLSIGNGTCGAHLSRDIVGFACASTMVQVVADRRVTVMSEFSGRLAVPLIPPGRMNE
jgi:hypothetical protein